MLTSESGSTSPPATSTRNSKRLEIDSNPENRTTRSDISPTRREKIGFPDNKLDNLSETAEIMLLADILVPSYEQG